MMGHFTSVNKFKKILSKNWPDTNFYLAMKRSGKPTTTPSVQEMWDWTIWRWSINATNDDMRVPATKSLLHSTLVLSVCSIFGHLHQCKFAKVWSNILQNTKCTFENIAKCFENSTMAKFRYLNVVFLKASNCRWSEDWLSEFLVICHFLCTCLGIF